MREGIILKSWVLLKSGQLKCFEIWLSHFQKKRVADGLRLLPDPTIPYFKKASTKYLLNTRSKTLSMGPGSAPTREPT